MEKPCLVSEANSYRDGYPEKKIKGKLFRLHRLTLETNLGRPINAGMYALHTCGNRWCVEPSHLYEGTHQQNMDDMKQSGRSRTCGSPRKLSESEVRQVRERLQKGETGSKLAREYGVHKSQISRVKNGKAHGWVS